MKLGTQDVTDIKLGDKQVTKVMQGTQEIWSNSLWDYEIDICSIPDEFFDFYSPEPAGSGWSRTATTITVTRAETDTSGSQESSLLYARYIIDLLGTDTIPSGTKMELACSEVETSDNYYDNSSRADWFVILNDCSGECYDYCTSLCSNPVTLAETTADHIIDTLVTSASDFSFKTGNLYSNSPYSEWSKWTNPVLKIKLP